MSTGQTVIGVVDRWMFPRVPGTRLSMLRILTGLYALIYLAVRSPHLASFGGMPAYSFRPVGVAQCLDAPMSEGAVLAWTVATTVLAIPFLLGFRYRLFAPLFAACLWWLLTYSNSFGKILHTDNLLLLHVCVLAVAPAADALAFDAQGKPTAEPHGRYGWPIRTLCLVTVAAYVLAGIAKLRLGGMEFVSGDTLRNLIAYDNLRKLELGSVYSPLGVWSLQFPVTLTLLAGLSLLMELGAPLALLHARLGRLWALMMWGFHASVVALMAIVFAYPLTVGFACFFPCESVLRWKVFRRVR